MFTMSEARDRFAERTLEFRRKAGAYFHDYKPEAG